MILSISVPKDGELLIKTGDSVDFSTPLINNHVKKEVKVPLSKHLRINPKKIFTVLKKFVGEKIKKGDLVAFHKAFMGDKKYLSEFDGTIKEVNHHDGTITFEIDSEEKKELTAYFKGEIIEIDDKSHNEKFIIKFNVNNAKHYELKEVKEYFGGPVFYSHDKNVQIATEDDVNGKIVCITTILPYEQSKLETLGAVGFIGLHSLPDSSDIPHAKVLNIPDWDDFITIKLPFCTIDKDTNKLYIYE